MKPYLQGKLDGMCGVYALLNAFHYFTPFTEEKGRKLIEDIIRKERDFFPKAFYEGLLFTDLTKIVKNSIRKHRPNKLTFYVPVRKKTSISDWFDVLEKTFEEKSAIIVSMGEPIWHWSLAIGMKKKANGRYLVLFDSYFGRRELKESRFTLYNKKGRFQILPTETIVIKRK